MDRWWGNPRIKPPFGAADLIPGHALAPTALLLCNEGGGLAVHMQGVPLRLAFGTATSWAAGQEGVGVNMTVATGGADDTAPPIFRHPTIASVLWRGIWVATPSGEARNAGVHTNAINLGPNYVSWIVATSGGKYIFYWNDSASYRSLLSASGPTVGLVSTLAGTIDGVTARLYVNGKQDSSTTSNVGTITYDAGATVGIGRASGAGTSSPAVLTSVAYFYPGLALTADQIRWLHTEPYAMLRPIVRRRYFVAPVAANNAGPLVGPNILNKALVGGGLVS